MEKQIQESNVVIATMEFLTSPEYQQRLQTSSKTNTLHAIPWRRVIFDECHETILLGGQSMNILRSFEALNVWCVSGTPFTHNDQSIYGIHQLLNIEIRLNVTNNPFAMMAKTSYRNEAFEYLKKHIYLRNTPESIAAFRKTTGSRALIAQPRYEEHIIFLPYTVFERAFYDERLTRIESTKNLYSERLEPLRQLCCHPEASEEWNQRIADLDPRTNRVYVKSFQAAPPAPVPATQKGLSLDQLPARMIKVKRADLAKLDMSHQRIQNRIGAARNSIAYCEVLIKSVTLSHHRVTQRASGKDGGTFSFYDLSADLGGECVEDWAEEDETGFCRFRVVEPGQGVMYVRPQAGMENLSNIVGNMEKSAFVKTTQEWVAGQQVELRENRKEKEKSETEMRYFLSMVESLQEAENEVARSKLKGYVADEGDSLVMAPSEKEAQEKENVHECSLCNEEVTMLAVLGCGHSSCRPCLDTWFEKSKSCHTCRKIINDNDEIFDFNASKKEPTAPATETPIREEPPKITPMILQPVPPIVMKHGTKPAAVADFLRKTLAESPDNRIIVFSKWQSMLNLLAKSLNTLEIPNLFPKLSLNKQIAHEAYESKHAPSTPSSSKKKSKPTSTPQLEPHPQEYDTASCRISDPIQEFKTSREFRILMLSLEESASGTNLQCANVIVMLEPASGDNSVHAIATEQQAIGRAVRYGQTKLVQVYKFIVKGTIEEDLYRFQEVERKKRLALSEGNIVHLQRARLIESDAMFTRHDIEVSGMRVVEEEPVQEVGVAKEGGDVIPIEDDSEDEEPPAIASPPPRPVKMARNLKLIQFCCPICNKDLDADSNAEMNVHVDDCLVHRQTMI
ncbi:DNA helicase rad5 [Podochytrium sp. JEL0797]|nr:DNA helicase rad5 [Podochytrium sp. JEL0797]